MAYPGAALTMPFMTWISEAWGEYIVIYRGSSGRMTWFWHHAHLSSNSCLRVLGSSALQDAASIQGMEPSGGDLHPALMVVDFVG